eukprot:EG_transcript_13089
MRRSHCLLCSGWAAIAVVLLLRMLVRLGSNSNYPLHEELKVEALNNAIHLLQYQGPPALDRMADGRWAMTGPLLCRSLLSAAHRGLRPVVLGPVPGVEPKAGKVAALAAFVRRGHALPGDVVLFYDTDILVLQGLDAIEAAARTFPLRTHIVLSAERNCWPRLYPYPAAPTSFRYSNTGAVLAMVSDQLLRFLDGWQRCVADGVNDQVCAHWFFLDHRRGRKYLPQPVRLHLDHQCALTQNTFMTSLQDGVPGGTESEAHDWFVDGQVVNPETGSRPVLLHYNGDRTHMNATWAALFPNVSWDHPRLRQRQFTIWGRRIRGQDFCTSPIVSPSPAPAGAPAETLYGPPLPLSTKVWHFLLDAAESVWRFRVA